MVDSRGFFEKDFSANDFKSLGLVFEWVQENSSYSTLTGTVRGMHIQSGESGETKRVKCIYGSIFDIFIDLRRESKTFGKWGSVVLSSELSNQLYLPSGIAHGYQTLSDHTLVRYSHDVEYEPSNSWRINFKDPALGIVWPLPVTICSKEDSNAPTLEFFLENYDL